MLKRWAEGKLRLNSIRAGDKPRERNVAGADGSEHP